MLTPLSMKATNLLLSTLAYMAEVEGGFPVSSACSCQQRGSNECQNDPPKRLPVKLSPTIVNARCHVGCADRAILY